MLELAVSFLACFSFFFLSVENSCDQWAVDLHCTNGAEFLTTKAGNAVFAVNYGNALFHCDDMCRAYLGTFFTADAKGTLGSWLGSKGFFYKHCGKFTCAFKLKTAAHLHRVEIADTE